jgi:hypothetical protein
MATKTSDDGFDRCPRCKRIIFPGRELWEGEVIEWICLACNWSEKRPSATAPWGRKT